MEDHYGSAEHHFAKYGKAFQEKIFQSLMTDKEWAAQMIEIMNPMFFDIKYLQYLSEKFYAYYMKYKCFPTLGVRTS